MATPLGVPEDDGPDYHQDSDESRHLSYCAVWGLWSETWIRQSRTRQTIGMTEQNGPNPCISLNDKIIQPYENVSASYVNCLNHSLSLCMVPKYTKIIFDMVPFCRCHAIVLPRDVFSIGAIWTRPLPGLVCIHLAAVCAVPPGFACT